MTSKQEKLIENYIQKTVNRILNEEQIPKRISMRKVGDLIQIIDYHNGNPFNATISESPYYDEDVECWRIDFKWKGKTLSADYDESSNRWHLSDNNF